IQGQPCEIEPPHGIRQKSRQHDGPYLTVLQQFAPTYHHTFRRRNSILLNERVFFSCDRPVFLRCLVEFQPQGKPNKPETTSDEENCLPAKLQLQPNDQWRRHDGTNAHAAVEEPHREATFTRWKPFSNDFRCAGPVSCLT